MAVIKCPECQSDVSDRAMVCMKCGYPVGRKRMLRHLIIWLIFLAGALLVIFATLFIYLRSAFGL